ncbi:hypothetical protein GCM10009091_33770 [Pseudomonas brenneri]|nr:hypothetical protein GCM10009091_33770 [Pseudomonas brenneri]
MRATSCHTSFADIVEMPKPASFNYAMILGAFGLSKPAGPGLLLIGRIRGGDVVFSLGLEDCGAALVAGYIVPIRFRFG